MNYTWKIIFFVNISISVPNIDFILYVSIIEFLISDNY